MGTNNHTPKNYDKISRRCCGGIKGLRLNQRRFSVQRLRTNFLNIFRLLRRWKNYYKNGLRQLRRNLGRRKVMKEERIDVGFVNCNYNYCSNYRTSVLAHSNSFCSEAIADCLEFIKRNSVSVDDDTNPMLIQD